MDNYLTRLFLNPKTGKQQLHLALPFSGWVLGEWIGPQAAVDSEKKPSSTWLDDLLDARFYEKTFDYVNQAVDAYEALAIQAVAEGYFLTDIVDRLVREIAPGAAPKPDWQQAIDRFYLSVASKNKRAEPPRHAEARDEPMLRLLDGQHVLRADPSRAEAVRAVAEAALADIKRRNTAKLPMYTWSINRLEIEAQCHDLLFDVHDQLGDNAAQFAAVRTAYKLVPSGGDRAGRLAWMQCYKYPQFREDAFETAFHQDENKSYDRIRMHPEYSAYAARRQAEVDAKRPITRWRAMHDPSPEADIAAAEAALKVRYPADYRTFLAERGSSKWAFHVGRHSKELTFAGAGELGDWQATFQHWLALMTKSQAELGEDWQAKHGVDRGSLHTVATPWDNSSCVAMSLASGPRFGHCFLWHHDEPGELVPAGESFAAALKTIEAGFLTGNRPLLLFLDMHIEP
jgi:SMI1 / KNR4 family (SUKH-1)